jgi:CheY-like chemotaxis protein
MRVLIAHADEEARTRLADVVTRGRRLSLDILTVGDGPDALDILLAQDPPEVALIDWDLPGVEAPEMCRLVRDFHHHHDTWIIVLTPRARQESASEVWRAGADDCVYTPAPAKLLSERVTKGLCEMAPPIRDVTDVARAGVAAALTAAQAADAAAESAARPALKAVCACEDEVGDSEDVTGPAVVLQATVDADDPVAPAEPAVGPAELSAQCIDRGEVCETPRGPTTLDAVLVST